MNNRLSEIFLPGLDLCASYDWWAIDPNTHLSLLSIHHFVHISSRTRKPWGVCNSTTYQMTSLLPRMLCFILKTAKQLQPTNRSPIQASLSTCFVCKYPLQQNPGSLGHIMNQTTAFLPRLHICKHKVRYNLQAAILLPLRCLCTTCMQC